MLTCYLIEKDVDRNGVRHTQFLWTVAHRESWRWTKGTHPALKFANRTSAEQVVRDLALEGARIAEHQIAV